MPCQKLCLQNYGAPQIMIVKLGPSRVFNCLFSYNLVYLKRKLGRSKNVRVYVLTFYMVNMKWRDTVR